MHEGVVDIRRLILRLGKEDRQYLSRLGAFSSNL